MKGHLITFEGLDGCGKSTQASLLSAYLEEKGMPVLVTREPGGPPISEKIRELILDPSHWEMTRLTELFLYLASRSQHVVQVIMPALEKGFLVISERFTDSSVAYQGYGRGIDPEVVKGLNRLATHGLSPQLTFVLDISPQLALERVEGCRPKDRLESQNLEFYIRVREGYLALEREEKRINLIDGRREIEKVGEEIKDIVNSFLKEESERGNSHEK
jgi:dTMP kinase